MLGKKISPRFHEQEQQFLQNGGEFKKCKASDLFKLKTNPQLDKVNFIFSDDSKYPYFTRTVANNGILGYVNYLDEEHKIKGNSIAVGMLGMQFFYMKHDFYAGQFTKTAFPLFEGFNERVALWFVAWFNKSSRRFQSVLVRNFETEFNNTEILVPYIDGHIAIDFIEECIRELENDRMHGVDTYLKITGLENCTLTIEEKAALELIENSNVNMKEIIIGDLFDIVKGKRLTKSAMIPGKINFIGATSQNNGITARIANDNFIHPKNTITVTYNGSVGEAFYQTECYWASDDVNVLHFKEALNEDLALFFLAPLKKKGKKYAYSYKWTKEKMAADKIYLPIDSSNNIDFSFMETYIRAIKKQCIARLKEEISREQKIYNKIINE